MNKTLWVFQGVLAALFLFAGTMKLILPIAAMTKEIALPGAFLRFVGIAETLGALGLILPWALRIRRELTPLAASGLVIIMIGATTVSLKTGGLAAALLPFVTGCLSILVASKRWSELQSQVVNHQQVFSKHVEPGVDLAGVRATY